MNLQLVYRYMLSLSKNENIFTKKQKQKDQNKKGKSFRGQESNPSPPTWKANALSVAPRLHDQIIKASVNLIIFNTFADEILPVDADWSR